MDAISRFSRALLITLALLDVLIPSSLVVAQSNESKRVLILLENDVSWPIFRLIDENARTTLRNGSPEGILIFGEHLDRGHFVDPVIQAAEEELIKKKYANSKLDLVMAVGSVPTDLFPGVPLVYMNADSQRRHPGSATSPTSAASVWVSIDVIKTLQLARRLQPRARQIVVVGEDYSSGSSFISRTRAMISASVPDLRSIYLMNLSIPEICRRVAALGPESIVLFMAITRDSSGRPLISAEVAGKVSVASGAPMYVLFDTHVGTGAVGGFVASFAEIGKQGGELGLRMLAGEHPQDAEAQNVYLFDDRQLRRWNISASALPPGSVVLYHQRTVWESYKRYIVGAILLCLLETLLILGLWWQRAIRKRHQQSLIERMAFEKMLSDLSTTFINLHTEHVDAKIENSLGPIAEFLKLSGITLIEYSRGNTELVVIHSWRSEGVQPAPATVSTSDFPWWTDRLLRGEVVLSSDLNALPEEASVEREYLQKLNAVSVAAIPLKAGEEFFGGIAFVSTKHRVLWTKELVEQLKLLAEIFSNALMRKRAQEAQFRHAAIVESSDDAIISKDLNGFILSWNTGAERIFGYSEAEAVGQPITMLIPDDLLREEDNILRHLKSGGRIEHHETVRLTKDSKKIHVSLTISPLKDSAGAVVGASRIVRDITDRKLAEKALLELSGQLINAQEKERSLIARELHDDICQRLVMLSSRIERATEDLCLGTRRQHAQMKEIWEQSSNLAGDVQALSHKLHSSILDHLGLVAAAENFCQEFSQQHDVSVSFTHRDVPESLPQELSLSLFRILQEGVRNAYKHSGVNRYSVCLEGNSREVHLEIRDWGTGFDIHKSRATGGIGLISMEERANILHGALVIESSPQQGTKVRVSVPLRGIAAMALMKATAG